MELIVSGKPRRPATAPSTILRLPFTLPVRLHVRTCALACPNPICLDEGATSHSTTIRYGRPVLIHNALQLKHQLSTTLAPSSGLHRELNIPKKCENHTVCHKHTFSLRNLFSKRATHCDVVFLTSPPDSLT